MAKAKGIARTPASTNLFPDVLEEIDRLAVAQMRTRSQLLEKFVLRGLAAFKRDGLLEEPARGNHQMNGETVKIYPKEIKRPAPARLRKPKPA